MDDHQFSLKEILLWIRLGYTIVYHILRHTHQLLNSTSVGVPLFGWQIVVPDNVGRSCCMTPLVSYLTR